MNILHDQNDRELALNPTKSFIVQAPAGSGKTELLMQRFLVLLNSVKLPEEILAITFTKKSAQEMRSRIINTLKKCANSQNIPKENHAIKTYELAKKVLERNEKLQWNLLENPNRLRIQTIDSFNSSLTRNLPILSQFGATPEISDNPGLLYKEAVQEFLTHLEEDVTWKESIAHLLLHMDNDLNKVESLLVTMLAKRDQWLPHIAVGIDHSEFRNQLELSLKKIILTTLSNLTIIFNKEISFFHKNELLSLLNFSAINLLSEGSQSFITYCEKMNDIPEPILAEQKIWFGIAEFLLTRENKWRKIFTAKEGFPAPGKNARLKEFKDRAIALLNILSEHENLRQHLECLRSLPSAHYAENQWEILKSLHTVLQVAVAQLKLIFQKYGKIDYIENAQGALTALGTDDDPTDIALALDYRIQHILVDEFQDTANIQYRLLEKLITGWETDDGRTLFVVGDPMQSIYRFREAEVGLFIRSRKYGLGKIKLIPLQLSVNFRSTMGIVNWVNEHFKIVFPTEENISSGAVSYSESIANNNNTDDAVTLHSFINHMNSDQEQANRIIQLIHYTKEHNPQGTIAILVRTRSHLKAIIPALKMAKLTYRAIKIDPLDSRPFIQDLLSLTRALLYLTDRIAWLSLLRAPWCGLSLNDLLILTDNKQHISLWQQLQSNEIFSLLTLDGQKRLRRILPILKEKIIHRRRYSLRMWIESTWITLGGPACIQHLSDLEDAEAYFKLLEKVDKGSDLINFNILYESVTQLFATPDNFADEKLQIMTIHNAKGLEFDTVILPHLERKTSQDDKQLLLWTERYRDEGSDLIISPVNAIGDSEDTIYNYIKRELKIKSRYEDSRLLYVAATRAKKHLHLLFSLNEHENSDEIKPTTNSLLEKLWPAIRQKVINNLSSQKKIMLENSKKLDEPLSIRRLISEWKNPIDTFIDFPKNDFNNDSSHFTLSDNKPKIIGVIIHRILQELSRSNKKEWPTKNSEKQQYIFQKLIQAGLAKKDFYDASNQINTAIQNILNDSRGQWILKNHHDAQSEFSINALIDNKIMTFIIDRTFVDENGTRWIIDYKTTLFAHDDLEAFLLQEKNKYEKQLFGYYQAMKKISSQPIRIGLYFPMIPAWKEWDFLDLDAS